MTIYNQYNIYMVVYLIGLLFVLVVVYQVSVFNMDKKQKLSTNPHNRPIDDIKSNKSKHESLEVKKKSMTKCKIKSIDRPANVAAFCQKKCFGANNWKLFLDSQQTQKIVPVNKKDKALTSKILSKQSNNDEMGNPLLSDQKKTLHTQQLDPRPRNQSNTSCKMYTWKVLDRNSVEGKGNRPRPMFKKETDHFNKQPKNKNPVLTKQIAIDCEMVGVEIGVNKNMLARISLVNALGDCIYDKFVKPTEPVLDYRTFVSGVRPEDLKNAEDFKIVQKEVAAILEGRILVGHALKNDLKVLYLSHPKSAIRDTSKYKLFRDGKTPSLKKLAKKYLDVSIQDGEHSSVQDALAAMQLYRMYKKEWEASLRSNKKFQTKGKAIKGNIQD